MTQGNTFAMDMGAALWGIAAIVMIVLACRAAIFIFEVKREEYLVNVVDEAGGPNEDNKWFFTVVLYTISQLQNNEGRIGVVSKFFLMEPPRITLVHRGTYLYRSLPRLMRNDVLVHLQNREPRLIIACNNISPAMLKECRTLLGHDQKYQTYFNTLIGIPLLRAGHDRQPVYLWPFFLMEGAVSLRIKEEVGGNGVNDVCLGFLVCSRRAARQVQGLLLTLGEDWYLGNFSPQLRQIRDLILNQQVGPSVEICVQRRQLWQLSYKFRVPFTDVRAWRCLERVFREIQIHPVGGGAPKRYIYVDFGVPKLFDVLYIYQSV